ncbi:RNA exonuclease [Microdochium nivale]|nr:RNA exonuclease [Microdochium nivale]
MDPLSALRQMPCPKGDACTAFQCLFQHNDKPAIILAAAEYDPTKPLDLLPDPYDLQDTPRKRQNIHPDNSKLLTENTPPPSKRQKTAEAEDKAPVPAPLSDHTKLATRDKPVSPPPLSRSTHPGTATEVAQQPASRTDPERKSRELAMKGSETRDPSQSAPTATRKAETLNPRHIPKAPAQHDLRLKLVKLLYEQYKRLNDELKADASDEEAKLVMTDQQLIVRTLDEEQEAAIKKGGIYTNNFKNRIMTYKRMPVLKWKEERVQATKAAIATDQKLKKPDPSEPIVTGLTSAQEIQFLVNLITPLDSLAKFGYISTIPNDQEIEAVNQSVKTSGNTEICDRNGCGRRFQVFPGRREEDGALTSNGSCIHHPGKIYTTERSALDRLSKARRKYRCCQTDIDDSNAEKGCTTAPTHVFKASDPKRLASVLQFARTPTNDDVPSDRAIAFDCEMGYTVYGMELIRLTVVSWPDGAEMLDVLVQPYGEVLDLNTRYSGVRPEDMASAIRWKPGDDHRPAVVAGGESSASGPTPTIRKLKLVPSPKAARDLMFALISPQTPVIGHALENDLNAVRMVHPTVVDTVLLYPHRRGALPLRYGLKYLMDTHLGRQIQTAGETPGGEQGAVGHDSAEDARAAGDLVRLKVKEEWAKMQVDGWTLDVKTGSFVAPPASRAA